jgi:hypothetical protein
VTTWSEKCRERRRKGLCHKCDSPPVPGRTECQHHLDIDRASLARRRAKRQAAGVCVECGGKRAKDDAVYCSAHRKRHRESERKYNERRKT